MSLRRIVRRVALLGCLVIVNGCQLLPAPLATPVAALPSATATLRPLPPTPTRPLELAPTNAVQPTVAEPEPSPTAVTDPTATAEPPAATPTVVATAETGQALPSPTLPANLEQSTNAAHQALDDGDYAGAVALWQALLAQSPTAETRLGLARAHLGRQDQAAAIPLLQSVSQEDAAPELRAQALGLLAVAHEALGQWQTAIDTLSSYLALEDAAQPYVRWRLATYYESLDDDTQAAAQLEAADLRLLPNAVQAEILEKTAELHERLGQYDVALADYREILSLAQYEPYRALILQKGGQTLRMAGDQEKAVAQWQQVLQDYPDSYGAYLALLALDELRAADLGDLQRGLILNSARQYDEALAALKRSLSTATADETARAYYAIGQAQTSLGQYQDAFAAYDVIIRRYPQHALVGDAWLAKAAAETANGGDPAGLYFEFARLYPDHERAPEALWRAGVSLQSEGQWQVASDYYRALLTRYPRSSYGGEARFRQGLAAYAQNDMQAALATWNAALPSETDAANRARLLTFLGLALMRSGQAQQAHAYWRQAVDAAPDSYYGRRAADLTAGQPPVFAPDVTTKLTETPLAPDDWEALATWVAGWHAGGAAYDMAADPLARRAQALLALGWRAQAIETLTYLREQARTDPPRLLALIRLCDELGIHATTIAASESLLAQSIAAQGPPAPLALRRLLYPTAYGHLVQAQADRYAIDPLWLLALIRQESRFEPSAVSYSGATGLMQVMPATGAWIAERVGLAGYRQADLNRPMVSVQFGAWFASWLLDRYDRDWFAALIAYNAGPGNLAKWTNGQPILDHDLFYELIPGQQAQNYVRLIYQQYRRYQGIYR
jgi:soluble lytic murein transglycosylase